MADLNAGIAGLATGFRKFKDMLDGTWAEVVAAKSIGADGLASGGGTWVEADNTLTRPANATPTVVHGSIGSSSSCLFTFNNFFDAAAQNSVLMGLKMAINLAAIAVPASIAIRMHLYQDDETAVDLVANNDASTFKTMVASAAKKFGYVDFSTWTIGGTGSDMIESYGVPVFSNNVVPLKAAAAARGFYAIGEATAIFTPVNAGVMRLYAARAGL